jgi:hypothetical protein
MEATNHRDLDLLVVILTKLAALVGLRIGRLVVRLLHRLGVVHLVVGIRGALVNRSLIVCEVKRGQLVLVRVVS